MPFRKRLKRILRERKRSEKPEAMDEDNTDVVTEIKPAHFEESMKYARRSDADIRKYQIFAQTLQQSRGHGTEHAASATQTGATADLLLLLMQLETKMTCIVSKLNLQQLNII